MSSAIEVLSVIDGQFFTANSIQGGASAAAPTNVTGSAGQFVKMISNDQFEGSGQQQPQVNITANPGDQVQWTMTCLFSGTTYNAVLVSVGIPQSGPLAGTSPEMLNINKLVSGPGGNPEPVNYPEQILQSQVLNPGATSGVFTFQLFDQGNNSLGFFCWDADVFVR